MPNLHTLDEIKRLLEKRPQRTTTYQIPQELLARVPADAKVKLRTMTAAELKELAAYLRIGAKELKGPFKVVNISCPHCDRHTTFLDFVKTGIAQGGHDRNQLTAVLTGQGGAWLTIRGEDGGRPVVCATCDQQVFAPAYSEYSGGGYAYA